MGVEEMKNEEQFSQFAPSSLLSTLDQFLYFATGFKYPSTITQCPKKKDGIKVAVDSTLCILQNLPSARRACLTYLSDVLSQHVWKFMQNKRLLESEDESIGVQISAALNDLIEISPNVWCWRMAEWSVGLLGKWSCEWEDTMLSQDATLEERVATWNSCTPCRILANLTVSCVAQNPDKTVAALLDESVRTGPTLNWLVAHVGCSFPATIINRILFLGLQSFVGANTSAQASKLLKSINSVLNHLAERHLLEIQRELHNIMITGFSDENDLTKAVVPYLLQLLSFNRSRALFKALSSNLPQILQSGENASLSKMLSWWIPKYFPSSQLLVDIIINLLIDISGASTCEIIFLLLQRSFVMPYSVSNKHSQDESLLVDSFLYKLTFLLYRRSKSSNKIPILKSIGSEVHDRGRSEGNMSLSDLLRWCLHSEKVIIVKRMGQLLSLSVTEQGSDASSYILQNLFKSDYPLNSDMLFLLNVVVCAIVRSQADSDYPFKSVTAAISFNLCHNSNIHSVFNTVKKLNALMDLSAEPRLFIQEAVVNSLMSNIGTLAKLMNVPTMSEPILELICFLPLEKPLSLNDLMSLSHAVIYYFFKSITSNSKREKLKSFNYVSKILLHLAHSSLANSVILRLIFESVLSPDWSHLFGAKENVIFVTRECPKQLLLANNQFDSWVKVPTSHNTRFHAGKIGRPKLIGKRLENHRTLSVEEKDFNAQLMLNLISICCKVQGTNNVATTLALLMVEYISPDIMFNGFPWPEEYIKFTFERDLLIKKTFDDFPVIWRFLDFISRCRPALCYCSVLMRALAAALTAYWNTSPLLLSSQDPEHLRSTKFLIEIMVVGQFLPAPFSVLPQMVDKLAPFEIVCVLQDIWAYLRDHTPSPDRWMLLPYGIHHRASEPTDSRYTERILKLIHIHIDIFGHLLPTIIKS